MFKSKEERMRKRADSVKVLNLMELRKLTLVFIAHAFVHSSKIQWFYTSVGELCRCAFMTLG